MNAKEKALELFDKMYAQMPYIGFNYNQTYIIAKQCATITVDEILEAIIGTYDFDSLYDYWQEVKQEIENL